MMFRRPFNFYLDIGDHQDIRGRPPALPDRLSLWQIGVRGFLGVLVRKNSPRNGPSGETILSRTVWCGEPSTVRSVSFATGALGTVSLPIKSTALA